MYIKWKYQNLKIAANGTFKFHAQIWEEKFGESKSWGTVKIYSKLLGITRRNLYLSHLRCFLNFVSPKFYWLFSVGVTSFKVDLESKKVVVMGDITPSEVLESVSKVKFAELWVGPYQASKGMAWWMLSLFWLQINSHFVFVWEGSIPLFYLGICGGKCILLYQGSNVIEYYGLRNLVTHFFSSDFSFREYA